MRDLRREMRRDLVRDLVETSRYHVEPQTCVEVRGVVFVLSVEAQSTAPEANTVSSFVPNVSVAKLVDKSN
jgi:hypothetical protein